MPDAASFRIAEARRAGGARLALAGLAAALLAQAAPAQLAPGFSGRLSTLTMDGDEAMRTLRAFGHCYASQSPAGAWSLIATEPGSREEAETYRRLFRRDSQACLGENTELQVPVALVRGAIAEGLYARRVAVPANLRVPPAAPDAPVRALSEAAHCFIAAHRDRARALVEQTAPGSRPELAALREISPDFFDCVPETARNRQFNATQVRYRLAEALLRSAVSPGER